MDNLHILRSQLASGGSRRNSKRVPLHQTQLNCMIECLENVFQQQNSCSLFLLGPPFSGKTTLVESAVQDVTLKYGTDSHIVIRLHGKLCINFRISVESICKQLGKNEELDNLLSNKSHFDERIPEILQFLRESLRSSKWAIIIILEDVELFCEHQGQALLYNILDAIQSRETALCLIGVTTRQDILELLEKRVKSRFSHRILSLGPLDLDQYLSSAEQLLGLKDNSWNKDIADLFKETKVVQTFKQLHDSDSSIGTLVCFLYTVLLQCGERITSKDICRTFEGMSSSSRIKQIMDFTSADLYLLASIRKVMKHGTPIFNFQKLCETVGASAQKAGLTNKDLLFAMKSLENLELITSLDKKNNKMDGSFRAEITPEEIDTAFSLFPNLPTDIRNIVQ